MVYFNGILLGEHAAATESNGVDFNSGRECQT